jgi:hypothetical protein
MDERFQFIRDALSDRFTMSEHHRGQPGNPDDN